MNSSLQEKVSENVIDFLLLFIDLGSPTYASMQISR